MANTGKTTRNEVLDDLTSKAQKWEMLLALLAQTGDIQKHRRVRRQVIYKTRFVVRKPRTKKSETLPPANETLENSTL